MKAEEHVKKMHPIRFQKISDRHKKDKFNLMKIFNSCWILSAVFVTLSTHLQAQPFPAHTAEKTTFQSAAPWRAEYDIRADVAMVYGIESGDLTFEEKVESWRSKGYKVHFMTGISWGNYDDYFKGVFDGETHYEDSQVDRDGNVIWHSGDIPYVVPSPAYLTYIKSLVKRAIDAGVSAIHMEEPELWARAGYSEGFKKEWQRFYGTSWVAQHSSPEATYMSSKLKSHLYLNALKEVFAYAKAYSRSKGNEVACYVPTHSLLSYSAIDMVSPEADLAQLPDMDGYIGQIWTGTARVPVWFNGTVGERVFENAFLEYGSMASMTAPTGRKVFFLTDPVEDAPRTWDDYKRNYQATFVAQLLYPQVADYEVMPWPNRIYLGNYTLENNPVPQPISPDYATQVQVMINTLNEMPVSENRVNGTQGVGVLISNSMMYQRFPKHEAYDDPQLSNYYGLALPLLKRGIPVENVFMENLNLQNTLRNIKLLVVSYSNMKPLKEAYNIYLSDWVKQGGILVYCASDQDPFQTVKEWWNTGINRFSGPSAHLFAEMGMPEEVTDCKEYNVGNGKVYVFRKDPKMFVMTENGDAAFLKLVEQAYKVAGGELTFKNSFYLQRGVYDIAAVMSESVSDEPLVLTGPYIDLFDPELPILARKVVHPGEQTFLYSLARLPKQPTPEVIVSSARIYGEEFEKEGFTFLALGPTTARAVMRIALKNRPTGITVTAREGAGAVPFESAWDETSGTLLLSYGNVAGGNRVSIK